MSDNSEKDHPHHEVKDVGFGVLTVSSSRTLAEDEGGDALVASIEADGFAVEERSLVGDDEQAIATGVLAMVESDGVDALVVTGGTGLAPADVTPEAVRPLADRAIPGFGELFRSLSQDDIGPRALLSRAFGVVIDGVPVFCLPGSRQGAVFGTEELILPTVAHIVGHTQGH